MCVPIHITHISRYSMCLSPAILFLFFFRVLAQMQGAKKGQRPVTAVLTEAEKLKFDRSVLGFLTTSPASGNRNQHQFIDYDAMAESWNDDVALEEEQVRKGLVVECGHNIVNRKTPSGLKFHMNESKRALNAKRTLAPHKEQLQALNKSQRVSLMPFKSAAGASVGLMPTGDHLVFPIAAPAASARPRPKPAVVEGASPENGRQERGAPGGEAADGGGGAGTLVVPAAARDRTVGQPSGGGSSVVGGVGAGAAGAAGAAGTSGGSVAGGAPCFVTPVPVCGTFRLAAPSFGVQPGLLQTWNPQLAPAPAKPSKQKSTRSNPTCQKCGHRYTTGAYADSVYHIRSGGKYQCLVKDGVSGGSVREPDFPDRSKQRYKTCTCALCAAVPS